MMKLALFDLDHTLLPIDSDHEWGEFLVRVGAVDGPEFTRRNDTFYAHYQAGQLDPVAYLEFALGTLAQFPRERLDALHAQFMAQVIEPAVRPSALALVRQHQDAGHLVAIVTATNHFVTAPIARRFGVEHLIAAMPQYAPDGQVTGQLAGLPTYGRGKVAHTHTWLNSLGYRLDKFVSSHFYSDSHNDIPLMSLVSHPVATNPNPALTKHASAQGWPLLHLFND